MSGKSKINPIEKVKIVERYPDGEIGLRQAGRELGAAYQSIQEWVSITPTLRKKHCREKRLYQQSNIIVELTEY